MKKFCNRLACLVVLFVTLTLSRKWMGSKARDAIMNKEVAEEVAEEVVRVRSSFAWQQNPKHTQS